MARTTNVDNLKAAAAGRWLEIFAALAGVRLDADQVKRHGPCPKCGGTDRFRILDLDAGALLCNQCFHEKNGDGIAALGWLTGKPFKEVVALLAEYLGVKPAGRKPKPEPPKHASIQGAARYFAENLTRQHGRGVKHAATWDYGPFQVLRFDLPTPAGEKQRKEFRPVRQVPLGDQGAIGWQGGYPQGLRPLYRACCLTDVDPPDLVTVHGGEKAADAARAMGLLATTCAGGEQAVAKTDWRPLARFGQVAVVVDNDSAGERFGHQVAAAVRAVRPGADVRIVRLPGLPPKGDVVEWAAAGGTRERFLELVAEAPPHATDAPPATPPAAGAQSNGRPPGPIDPLSEDRRICEALGIDVLGEDESGAIRIFSTHFGKTATIRQIADAKLVYLAQRIGPVMREKVHDGRDEIPGLWPLRRVQEAIGLLGGSEAAGAGAELGQGVWRAQDDVLVLVSPKGCAAWDGRELRPVNSPRVGGVTINMDLPPKMRWFDAERLAENLRLAANHKWCEAALDDAATIFRQWNWPAATMGAAAELVCGLILATFVQSVWTWRPLVGITAESDSGKSLFLETLASIFGKLALLNAKSTAAGIRQAVQRHGSAILCDEFENDKNLREILEYFRTASRGSQTLRGTANQHAQHYGLRHIPWCAAVGIKLDRAPDRNRFIFLEFLPVPKERRGKIDLPTEADLADLGQRLLAIAVRHAVAADLLAVRLRNTQIEDVHGRVVESFSTPVAMLTTAIGLDDEQAINVLKNIVAKAQQDPGASTKDQTELLGEILASKVQLDRGAVATVSQILTSPDSYSGCWDALERHGVSLIGLRPGDQPAVFEDHRGWLFIATRPAVRYLLQGTRWEDQPVDQILLRLDGARRGHHRVAGQKPRGIDIPWAILRDKFMQIDNDDLASAADGFSFT